MGLLVQDDHWRIPDNVRAKIEPLLPPGKPHPLGGHNPRVPNRNAMDASLFVRRSGCQWSALDATGICSSSSAHRRFREGSRRLLKRFAGASLLRASCFRSCKGSSFDTASDMVASFA
jgi:transposase